MEERKILAIFGGSFNPPLNSHFLLAEQIYNEIENIEKVIFLPVSSKYENNDLLSNEHRYNMLKSVIDNIIAWSNQIGTSTGSSTTTTGDVGTSGYYIDEDDINGT